MIVFQNVVVIRHKVANFRRWKAVFDAHGPSRLAQGCQRTHVFRRADNPKELVVMLTWSDLGKARQFVASEDLRDMLAEAGVSDRSPDVYVLQELEEACHSTLHDGRPAASTEPSRTIADNLATSVQPAPHEPTKHHYEGGTLTDPGWIR